MNETVLTTVYLPNVMENQGRHIDFCVNRPIIIFISISIDGFKLKLENHQKAVRLTVNSLIICTHKWGRHMSGQGS
jgi:hypothetical protein